MTQKIIQNIYGEQEGVNKYQEEEKYKAAWKKIIKDWP